MPDQDECPGKFQVVQDPPEQVRSWIAGADLHPPPPPATLKLVLLIMRSKFSDPHLAHFIAIFSSLFPMTRISMYSSHSIHLNSYIGIMTPFKTGCVTIVFNINGSTLSIAHDRSRRATAFGITLSDPGNGSAVALTAAAPRANNGSRRSVAYNRSED
jgi:hypothetical protein